MRFLLTKSGAYVDPKKVEKAWSTDEEGIGYIVVFQLISGDQGTIGCTFSTEASAEQFIFARIIKEW